MQRNLFLFFETKSLNQLCTVCVMCTAYSSSDWAVGEPESCEMTIS